MGLQCTMYRAGLNSATPIVLVIKAKYMYHIEVSPNPTNKNTQIHESGVIPLPSSCSLCSMVCNQQWL